MEVATVPAMTPYPIQLRPLTETGRGHPQFGAVSTAEVNVDCHHGANEGGKPGWLHDVPEWECGWSHGPTMVPPEETTFPSWS